MKLVLHSARRQLRQALDDVAEVAEARIDMLRLLKPQALRGRAPDALGTSQVDEHEARLNLLDLLRVAFSHVVVHLWLPRLVHINMQYSMTPARRVIHSLACHLSESHSGVDDLYRLVDRLDRHLHQLLHVYLAVILLPNLQVLPSFGVE